MLRTQPAGAACSVIRDGAVVASVDVTPDYATVPRRNEPIEIVCHKGNLEHRRTLAAVPANEVRDERPSARECAPREVSAGELAAGFAAQVLMLFPPVAAGVIAVGVAAAATAEPQYAYRRPPELLLAPTTFDSESACDAYFAALKARLETEADAQRAKINGSCHPWPCNASDPVCPSPSCEVQRLQVNAGLLGQLNQLPELRARVRVVPH